MQKEQIPWPHAPVHKLSEQGAYIVTAGTLYKAHYFREPERLTFLHQELLMEAQRAGWHLQAWAVFSNHYHFIGVPLTCPTTLPTFIAKVHKKTASWVNHLDKTPKRTVWHNYWDTHLTYNASYLPRLKYVHNNAVKHGLVKLAQEYPWCSARWFDAMASKALKGTLERFKTDKLRILDDF